MATVSVKEIRRNLSRFIEAAQRGTPVTITRRGRNVATLVGINDGKGEGLPDLTAFRASLGKSPKRRTTTIEKLRQHDRY